MKGDSFYIRCRRIFKFMSVSAEPKSKQRGTKGRERQIQLISEIPIDKSGQFRSE